MLSGVITGDETDVASIEITEGCGASCTMDHNA
jgi:hypothetical protein